ncbi:hypothetical protein ABZV77_36105 [Streptomyces sp. NPDC004732]|uniref:hypothetical protein n=1 Tax=Streptomyces sp. NPDC004732 TaxID=3154290 RepID=UPI0033A15C35
MATTRNGTGHGRLLLLAALLLGIVTMHTLGHPSGGHEGGAARSAGSGTVSSAMGHGMGGARALDERGTAPHERGATSSEPGTTSPGHVAAPTSASTPAPDSHGGMAMDPLSVCLAVLGAFTLLVLVRAGLLRPGGTLAQLPSPGRLLHALRPNPPPPRILLAQLSVLRI